MSMVKAVVETFTIQNVQSVMRDDACKDPWTEAQCVLPPCLVPNHHYAVRKLGDSLFEDSFQPAMVESPLDLLNCSIAPRADTIAMRSPRGSFEDDNFEYWVKLN